jgi:hypothetical protein
LRRPLVSGQSVRGVRCLLCGRVWEACGVFCVLLLRRLRTGARACAGWLWLCYGLIATGCDVCFVLCGDTASGCVHSGRRAGSGGRQAGGGHASKQSEGFDARKGGHVNHLGAVHRSIKRTDQQARSPGAITVGHHVHAKGLSGIQAIWRTVARESCPES